MSTRQRTWMILGGALGIGAVLIFGLALRGAGNGPLAIDLWWQPIPVVSPGGIAEGIAEAMNFAGSAIGVTLFGGLFALIMLLGQRFRDAATVVTALLIGVGSSELLKRWIERPRPASAVLQLHDASYPSGHSMGAAALSAAIILVLASLYRANRREGLSEQAGTKLVLPIIAGVLWTTLMMWSRTALGVHWLSDTVAGTVLGLSAALIAQGIWGASGARRGTFAQPIEPLR